MGLSAPVFFALAVALLGYLKPGYSHVYHTMSELGEFGSVTAQPAALVFTVTGIMITLFGYDLHRTLMRDDKMVWSGILVMLYGLLDFVGSGIFPVDAADQRRHLYPLFTSTLPFWGSSLLLGCPYGFYMTPKARMVGSH